MAKKVFRLVKTGNDLEHWNNRGSSYATDEINDIPNPDGDKAIKEPTSIPSPFARMDLVKSSFQYLLNKKGTRDNNTEAELNGNTIYHRIVSECLDVAELFFNYNNLSNQFEIVTWDSGIYKQNEELKVKENSDLDALISSSNTKHKLYGDTLKLFLSQDYKAYNFNSLKRIYILHYKKGPKEINVVGSTSPSSLFLSSANDLSFINLQFNSHKLFDKENPCPLFLRGNDFITYIFSLRRAMPEFSTLFSEIDKYIGQCYQFLSDELKEKISLIDGTHFNSNYQDITIGGNDGETAEILGFPLKGKNAEEGKESDFEIKSNKYKLNYPNSKVPLILPNDTLTLGLWYWDSPWQSDFSSPYFDSRILSQRTLPFKDHVQYPYLTISDFLEPYLIKLVYPIKSSDFFSGNISFNSNVGAKRDSNQDVAKKENSQDNHFVLPIKKDFFNYFDTKEFQGVGNDGSPILSDGKPMFEMEVARASVKVTLRVPIKSQEKPYITFKREYSYAGVKDSAQPDIESNKGIIVEKVFGATIYPFIKVRSQLVTEPGGNNETPVFKHFYRVMMVDRNIDDANIHQDIELSFSKNEKNKELAICRTDSIPSETNFDGYKRVRSQKKSEQVSSHFYVLEDDFDFINVSHKDASGILIPKFREIDGGTSKFSFAVDFGTSNTHVEYLVGTEPESVAFEITEKDIQIGTLHDTSEETINSLNRIAAHYIHTLPEKEFLPEFIGAKFDYKFPQRTILSEQKGINLSKPNHVLADLNIPFGYEKHRMMPEAVITPNLKWSNHQMNTDDKRRVGAFIEQLLLLIRNKVIINGGDLEKTELKWFYPSSMDSGRVGELEVAWSTYYNELINNKIPTKLSESIAPFYYFQKRMGKSSADRPIAAIDIGGGTSDIVIFQDDAPKLLSSFRFASNSIFGDGYNGSPQINGFVKRYKPKIEQLLSDNGIQDMVDVMNDINNTQHSENIIAFFFSIATNKKIKDNKFPISFQELIKDDEELRVLFLLFYSSIIYHLAKLMKAKGFKVPCDIIFSGTGSKVINIVDKNIRLEKLKTLTEKIFSKIYGEQNLNIEITQPRQPKEITCKGGLLCDTNITPESIQSSLLGDNANTILPINSLKYSGIDENVLNNVVTEFTSFTKIFFEINEDYDFAKEFTLSPSTLSNLKDNINSEVMKDLKIGLNAKKAELKNNPDSKVEETLFFYPLVGIINRLANKIVSTV
ncbi:MAG: hypothetical protein JWQ09_231 [Segetibacter sp.]|nr:hypothetical protein [Segetibacter sp.]